MENSESELRSRCVEFWNSCFSSYKHDPPELPDSVVSKITNVLRSEGCRDVLDLGCGFGSWSLALARNGFNVTAVDISEEALIKLRKRAESVGLVIKAVSESVDRFKKPNSYDAVLCISVLDHIPLAWAESSILNIHSSLRWRKGLLYATFDGCEEKPDSVETLPDSTWVYTSGSRVGMLWRYYSDSEIESLMSSFTILKFERTESGSARILARKA